MIDDDTVNNFVCESIIRNEKFSDDIISFEWAEDALNYLKDQAEKGVSHFPDLIFLDINMPVMNGYETAAALKKEWPKIKVLALSMYDTEFNIIKMLKAGARGYVLKDAEPKELQKALNTIFEEGFYHSELVTGKMHKQVKVEEKVTELSFTAKEEQFLSHCCSELTYKDIAELMNVSPRTVDGYREILFAKLDVKTRTGLVLYAIKSGIVNIA